MSPRWLPRYPLTRPPIAPSSWKTRRGAPRAICRGLRAGTLSHDYLGGPVAQIIGTDKLTVIVIKRRCIAFILWLLTVIVSICFPARLYAGVPTDQVRSTWQRITRGEQEEFVRLFTELLEESYVTNIESYSGEKILYGREIQEQDFAEVDTKIVTKRGEEVALNYKLHKIEGDWKVYDVVIENISMVNNYRSQFNRLLAKYSFAEVLDIIREKLSR